MSNSKAIIIRPHLKNLVKSIWSYRLVRWTLGIIFIWAGAAKLFDHQAFVELISWYELVPKRFLAPVAIGLPVVEVVAGLGLVFNFRASLETITALTMLFMAVLWFGILKGLEVDCGCFSAAEILEHDSLRTAFYRDFIFLAMAAYLYCWRKLQQLKVTKPIVSISG